jgi:diguanylate cyclase (GGDEF)-like protein
MTHDDASRTPLHDLLVFHQLARSLTSSFDLDTILRTILEQMEQFIEAELWTLLMVDPARNDLYYAIAAGGQEDALRELRVKIGEGVAGWVVQNGETLIVPEDDPRAQKSGTATSQQVRSVIAMPLRGRKGTCGAIEIFNPRADKLTDYTIAFLHILADYAAIAIENARDVAHIQQLTITDDITGLYNVRHLYDVLGQELESSIKRGLPLSLAFLDLDRFKQVNDKHGHLVGSELLALTGQRIRELSRKQDVCFRYGGDEFVVMMPKTDAATAHDLLSATHRALMDTHFQLKNGLMLSVSASAGLATCPDDATSLHQIIGIADSRMYAAKNTGRGQVHSSALRAS